MPIVLRLRSNLSTQQVKWSRKVAKKRIKNFILRLTWKQGLKTLTSHRLQQRRKLLVSPDARLASETTVAPSVSAMHGLLHQLHSHQLVDARSRLDHG